MMWPKIPDCKPIIGTCLICDGEGLWVKQTQVGQSVHCEQYVCQGCKGSGTVLRPMTVKERILRN